MKFELASDLVDYLSRTRRRQTVVGLCHGCFDVLHIGHIEHLSAAAGEVDVLVVSLTADVYVAKPGRPIFDEKTRARVVASLRPVDHVVVNRAPDALALLDALRPDLFFKGADYEPLADSVQHANFQREAELVRRYGGVVRITQTPLFSSTQVLELLALAGG